MRYKVMDENQHLQTRIRVVLFEFPEEVRRVTEVLGEGFLGSATVCAVSLNPKAEAYLKKRGIPCTNTLPFFDNESHERLVDKIEGIVSKVHASITLRDSGGVSHTYNHFLVYHLRFYLNYFFMHLELLERICAQYKVEELFYFQRRGWIAAKAALDDSERLLAPLIEEFCRQRHIRPRPLTLEALPGRKGATPWWDQIAGQLAKVYFRAYLALLKRYLKISKLLSKRMPTVIIPTWGYKFDDVMRNTKRRFPAVTRIMIIEKMGDTKQKIILILVSLAKFFPLLRRFRIAEMVIPIDILAPRFKKQCEDFLQSSLGEIRMILTNRLNEELSLSGVEVKDLLLEKMERGLWPELLELAHKVFVLKELYKEFRPELILSPFSTGFYYAMGELSQMMNIESCIITHGSHVPPQNRYEEIENYWLGRGVVLNDYRRVALQTPWLKKFMDYYHDQRPAIVAGPLVFASACHRNGNIERRKKALGIPKDKQILLYATTQKARHCLRFYITETLDEFVDSLKDIVEAVDKSERLFLVIRPHPVCDLSPADFKALLPQSKKFVIVSGGAFENVLSMADGLISYSSTCIEEALANGMPVILYDKWRRYKHFPLEEAVTDSFHLKDSPVTYVTSPDGLKQYFYIFERESRRGLWEDKVLDLYQYNPKNNENFYSYVGSCLNGGQK